MDCSASFVIGQSNYFGFVKDEIINNDTSMGQRKNLSPQQELNPGPPEHQAGTLSTELRELMESEVI